MNKREHLTKKGLVEIVGLVSKMNPSGKRNYTKTMILNSLGKMKI